MKFFTKKHKGLFESKQLSKSLLACLLIYAHLKVINIKCFLSGIPDIHFHDVVNSFHFW